MATIQQSNPNIFDETVTDQPIPSHPPNGFFSSILPLLIYTYFNNFCILANSIPDIGTFMLATFPPCIQHVDNW